VSPSWRERVSITLAPERVTLLRYSRGMRPARKDHKSIDCGPAGDRAAWQGSIEALREALVHPNTGAGDARVVLSNHFVRYLVLPWNPALAGEREERSFAAARFQQVYGEVARTWAVRLSRGKSGAPALAAAVEQAFLDAIKASLDHSPLRLRSLQPALMTACNVGARAVASNAWIAVAEPGRLVLGLQRGGQWKSLRSRPLDAEAVSLAELIEQELLLLGVEPAGEKIYVHRWGNPPVDVRGLKVEACAGFDSGSDLTGMRQ
jgi:hypothetical protein